VKKTIEFDKLEYKYEIIHLKMSEPEVQDKIEKKIRKPRIKSAPLQKTTLDPNDETLEIGVDEVGRGPLFGRVYTAAVILPKGDLFDHSKMKDSKKFSSKSKIQEVAQYIKENAIAWAISYEDEKNIYSINILQATQQSMHKCIGEVIKTPTVKSSTVKLLIDGNYFKPITSYNTTSGKIEQVPFECVEQGDNKFTCIAAASILAKVERDAYIEELCEKNPELVEHYSLLSNKGYGAKKHIEGIKEHGITIWHRRSFGICKDYV
jgi:ribonuclease HII